MDMIMDAFIDCVSSTTGYGLPQMIKPGNIFLSLIWTFFYLVGLGACVFIIYQAIEQFLRYDVITMTKIKSEKEMTLPALTVCNFDEIRYEKKFNTRDLVLFCRLFSKSNFSSDKCQFLTSYKLFDIFQIKNCIQFNVVTSKMLLSSVDEIGFTNGYRFVIYTPKDITINFALTDNSARVVLNDLNDILFPGQDTYLALRKTKQIALGPPYSECNYAIDYIRHTCIEDCFNKKMSEACGCEYPFGCAECTETFLSFINNRSESCFQTYVSIGSSRSFEYIKCMDKCESGCNQVNFSINRIDVNWKLNKIYYKLTNQK